MIGRLQHWILEIWHSRILWFIPAFFFLFLTFYIEELTDRNQISGWVGVPLGFGCILLGLLFAEIGRD